MLTGMDTLAHTCLRMEGPEGHLPPSWELTPIHSIHMSSFRLLHRIFIEPVQKHLLGAGRPGSQEDAGGRVRVGNMDEEGLASSLHRQGVSPSRGVWITG